MTWRDGDVPVSLRHGEAYYGDADALAEKRHVFVEGNGLPARFREAGRSERDAFAVAELGFGTGLNALATAAAWRAAGRPRAVRYTAFEALPLRPGDMARALRPWPELAGFARPMIAAWERGRRSFALVEPDAEGSGFEIEVIEGDAREELIRWDGAADAWFLDGFSPARNPEMWGADLIAALTKRARDAATLSTYSAAGHVRDTLARAGWHVERRPGHGRKKHMTHARLLPRSRNSAEGPVALSPSS